MHHLNIEELNKHIIQGEITDYPDFEITGLSRIDFFTPKTITFLGNEAYIPYVYKTNDAVILITQSLLEKIDKSKLNNVYFIVVEDPYKTFVKLLYYLAEQEKRNLSGISSKATIHPTAKIGNNVYIGDYVVIEENVVVADNVKIFAGSFVGRNSKIGAGTLLQPNVSVMEKSVLGKNCIIHSGVVIGSEGFGFMQDYSSAAQNIKIPQLGNVVIGNNVEIGANSTIDRAMLGSTIIEDNVKLDNLVHVAHNVIIGEGTVIAAQTGIAGSTKIGKRAMIGGQVGIVGHIELPDEVKIGAQSGVSKSYKQKGIVLRGSPAQPLKEQLKVEAILRKLPKLYKSISFLLKK